MALQGKAAGSDLSGRRGQLSVGLAHCGARCPAQPPRLDRLLDLVSLVSKLV